MPTKQELMHMMDNRLPGETLPLRESISEESPRYPDLERVQYASHQHMEHQQQQFMQQQQQQQQFMQQHHEAAYRPEAVYTVQQPTVISVQPPQQLGTRSHLAFCPSCHANQMTRCEYQSSMMTHIIAVVLCMTTCCCCVPYFFDSCKSARHYCGHCGTYLGSHTK